MPWVLWGDKDGKDFIVAICGVAHHEFSSSSWQTEVQDELCLNELLLAQPWWWLWDGILTSGICMCACKHSSMLCKLLIQCQQGSSH